MRGERGTALVEILVVGFAVMLVVLPALSAIARLSEARHSVQLTASDTASWIARHGVLPTDAGDGTSEIIEVDDAIVVRTTKEVELIGLRGIGIRVGVSAEARAPVSPYRSDR